MPLGFGVHIQSIEVAMAPEVQSCYFGVASEGRKRVWPVEAASETLAVRSVALEAVVEEDPSVLAAVDFESIVAG